MTYRLALVEDDGLERVIDKLLPALVVKLNPEDGTLMAKARLCGALSRQSRAASSCIPLVQ